MGIFSYVGLLFCLLLTLQNHGNPTSHKPELVLNNFTTRLGHRVGRWLENLYPFLNERWPVAPFQRFIIISGSFYFLYMRLLLDSFFRMIQSLFPQDPNFRGRRVVTFHNQRDYIFFRHHRCTYKMQLGIKHLCMSTQLLYAWVPV